jgi:RNA-directed DNA polymerase
MTTKLDGIATKAKSQSKLCFTALAHLITPAFLVETWGQMNRRGASGVDHETTQEFERNLDQRCQDIVARMRARQYQAPPVRRVEIPKGEGKTRPLGIPTVEDRLVQRAVARILESIYEADFLPFSYGFRPGRSPHLALQAVRTHLTRGRVNFLFETDIRGFFNHLKHDWLMRMLALRIGDPVILRLIAKWLKAGALVNGIIVKNDEGSPQGGPISPILANIYLHYALDLWFERRYARGCRGAVNLVRFADDFVVCFQHRGEAQRFQAIVSDRLGGFGLELAEEKTRLLTFGRWAREWLKGKTPETFVFLGFKHVCGTDRKGNYALLRIPSTKSCRKFLDRIHEWLTRNIHLNVWRQQAQLRLMLNGFYQYFGLHHCRPTLARICAEVYRQWVRILKRRSQRHPTWKYLTTQAWFTLPLLSRALHPSI